MIAITSTEYHDGNDLSLLVPVADASDFGYNNTQQQQRNYTLSFAI